MSTTCNYTSLYSAVPPYYGGIPVSIIYNVIAYIIINCCCFPSIRYVNGRLGLKRRIESGQDNDDFKEGGMAWFHAICNLKSGRIRAQCGQDAVTYLEFQRLLIFLTLVEAFFSAWALLINVLAEYKGRNEFFHTTSINLPAGSWGRWVLFGVAFFLFIFATAVFHQYSKRLQIPESEDPTCRTVLIDGIPPDLRDAEKLRAHFQNSHPTCVVKSIRLAYPVSKLHELEVKRQLASDARDRSISEGLVRCTHARIHARKFHCGKLWTACSPCCCPWSPRINAVEFYTERESRLSTLVDAEKKRILREPLGIAFVTFDNSEEAYSQVCSAVHPGFKAQFSPPKEDIIWDNLEQSSEWKTFRITGVIALLAFVFALLVVPAVYGQATEYIEKLSKTHLMGAFFTVILPVVLLYLMNLIMPFLVDYSHKKWAGHWTKSSANFTNMIVTVVFYGLVNIIPILCLTSAQVVAKWTMSKEPIPFHCMFMPENGAFFVNYMINCMFIGNALRLLRPGDLLSHIWSVYVWPRSEAEKAALVRARLPEFDFASQYAELILNFFIITVYSLSVPLMSLFGLGYLVLKHGVDRNNFYFVYGPSRCAKNIHTTAIHLVIIAFLTLPLGHFLYTFLHFGFVQVGFFGGAAFLFTVVIWILITFCPTSFSTSFTLKYPKFVSFLRCIGPICYTNPESTLPDLIEEGVIEERSVEEDLIEMYEPSSLANAFDVYGNIILPGFEGVSDGIQVVIQESIV